MGGEESIGSGGFLSRELLSPEDGLERDEEATTHFAEPDDDAEALSGFRLNESVKGAALSGLVGNEPESMPTSSLEEETAGEVETRVLDGDEGHFWSRKVTRSGS